MILLELAILVVSVLAGVYSLRSWWMASEKPPETTSDGSYLLRYSKNTFWLGFISVLLGSSFLFASYLFGKDAETGLTLFLMGAGMIGIGGWLISEYFNNRLIVNDRYIRKRNWLGRDTIIDWARLGKVKFSPNAGSFILESMRGEKIRVSRLMRGFKKFKEVLDTQAPASRIDRSSLEDFEKLEQIERELMEELE